MKKYFPKTSAHSFRRKGALERLEAQLEAGTKTKGFETIDLTEKDIKRINAEIEVLRERVS